MELNQILLFICGGVTLSMVMLAMKTNKEDVKLQERISALSRSESKTIKLRQKQMEGSFNDRVLFPLTNMIAEKTQMLIPLSSKSWIKAKLMQAGYQKPHYQKTFLGVQLLLGTLLFGSMFMFTTFLGTQFGGMIGIVCSAFFGAIGYGLPMLWLIQQAGKRQEEIQKSLADFLDILVICVEAGLGLDTAINKITSLKSVRTSKFLREELLTYTKDVGFGKPRRQALLDLADRTGVDDLNAIINALVQATEMGSSVAHTLRVQSDSLRVKRLAKAEEKANKIPVKMVLPIYIFLFPAIFVSIFGPIAMIMIDAVFKIMGGMDSFG